MNRKLNPELFESLPSTTEEALASEASVLVTRQLEKDLKETKKRVSHLESLLEVVQAQMSNSTDTNERRTEVFSKALSELEKDLREQDLTQSRQLKILEGRLREQQMVDSQMESMVERFNMNLVQFENKLAILQKVLSEKEMTLMSYRNIIEKIVDELDKLKGQHPNVPLR